MIENLALRLAEALKRADPERTASVAVMKYSLEGILNTLVTVLILCGIGLLTGKLGATVLGFTMFAILRFFSGGLHVGSALKCSLYSVLLLSVAPHIPLTDEMIWYAGALSAAILLIFAPSNIKGHARIPEKYFFLLKIISVLIVCSNFLWLNDTIAVVFLMQALTTIRFGKEV